MTPSRIPSRSDSGARGAPRSGCGASDLFRCTEGEDLPRPVRTEGPRHGLSRVGKQSRTPRRWRDAGAHPIVQLGPGWLRHPRGTAYRCFLPDLTGFTDPGCVGPDRQRRSARSRPNATPPRWGIRPRCSGLRVQGTANAPSSATEVIVRARPAGKSARGAGVAQPPPPRLEPPPPLPPATPAR
jgi:hypothetical protein